CFQTGLVSGSIEGLARLLGAQKLLKRHRTNEAADMGCENTVCASLHRLSFAPRRGQRTDSAARAIRKMPGACGVCPWAADHEGSFPTAHPRIGDYFMACYERPKRPSSDP